MILRKNNVFFGILLFGLTTLFFVLFNIQYFYLRAIFSFIFLIIIPGLLIILMLKIRKIGFWEYLVYIIGLSISFLMFTGLAINRILPWIHITDKPLALTPLLISLSVILSIFGIIAYKRNKKISLKISLPKFNLLNKLFFTIPIIFLILNISGAITLNNGGPNYLTMVMLGGIAIYVFLIVFLRDKLNENVFPWTVLLTSVSLLLMYSLRSWHISGWDVSQETYVFRLTMENQRWLINSYVNSYISCLSISILPTIINIITSIKTELIFKLIFQILFIFHSLTIFLIFRRYVNAVMSFIASFLYFGSVYYNSSFPSLTRQEIAFLFFGLMFLILFNNKINPKLKNFLFLIFGFSMVVSHYSTSYIAFAIFLLTYIFNLIYKLYENKRIKKGNLRLKNRERFYIKGKVILVLFLFQVIWIAQFSVLSNGLKDAVKNTYINIGNIFSESLKDSAIKNALFRNLIIEGYTDKELNEYINENKILLTPLNAYSKEQVKDYSPKIRDSEIIYSKNQYLTNALFYLYQFIKYSIILSIIFGSLFICISKTNVINKEFVFAIIISILLTFMIMLLPYVSKVYNFERLFQQSLMFLSFSSIIFFQKIMKRFGNLFLFFAILIYMGYSLFNTGFLLKFTGGDPTFNLYNTGRTYDEFYTHEEEIRSINWLTRNHQSITIYMDVHSLLKFYAFGNPKIKNYDKVIPVFMSKLSYVYSAYSNKIKGLNYLDAREKFNKGAISFNFPTEFLNENKNIIYNNGGSEIFK
jgi:uncharacterized membrane protein